MIIIHPFLRLGLHVLHHLLALARAYPTQSNCAASIAIGEYSEVSDGLFSALIDTSSRKKRFKKAGGRYGRRQAPKREY